MFSMAAIIVDWQSALFCYCVYNFELLGHILSIARACWGSSSHGHMPVTISFYVIPYMGKQSSKVWTSWYVDASTCIWSTCVSRHRHVCSELKPAPSVWNWAHYIYDILSCHGLEYWHGVVKHNIPHWSHRLVAGE